MKSVWATRIAFVIAVSAVTFLLMEWLVGGWEW